MRQLLIVIFFVISLFITSCQQEAQHPKMQTLHGGDVILAFGDSLTYGAGGSPGRGYPAEMEALTPYKVINAGKPGEETSQSVNRLSEDLERYHPQLVILCLGGNDMLRKRPVEDIKNNLKYMIQVIRQAGIQVVLIAVPRPSLGAEPSGFYKEIGKELQVPVDSTTLHVLLKNPEMKSDVIHLNQQGYNEMARAIINNLKKWGAIK